MPEHVQMAITAAGASDEELAAITRELRAWLETTAPGVEVAAPAGSPPHPGEKGAEIAIGALLLEFLKAGAATALINSLVTYIKERRRSVKVELRDASGRSISITADNVRPNEVDELVRRADQLARAPAPAAP
jgi:hypothetical protein